MDSLPLRLPAGFTRWTIVPPGVAYVARKGEWVYHAKDTLILRSGRRKFLRLKWGNNEH